MRGLPVEPPATSSAPLWDPTDSEWHHQGTEEHALGGEDWQLTSSSSWDAVRREAHFLREQLAAAVRTAESVVSGTATEHASEDGHLRIWLETARNDFLRFKKSCSAWVDIHTEDSALLARAEKLLDSLS